MNNIKIRNYKSSDCKNITELFYNTIHAVNSKDYTEEQLNAWAAGSADLQRWNESLSKNTTFIAVKGGVKDYQREGIATVICDKLEQKVQGRTITSQVSITASRKTGQNVMTFST